MQLAARLSAPRPLFWLSNLALLVAAWLTQAAAGGLSDTLALAGTAAAILGGCLTLGWLRPALVGIAAPQAMMLLGAAGMVAGLAVDAQGTSLSLLATLCSSAAGLDLGTLLRLHLEWLPAMHVGMAVGGLAAVPLLRLQDRKCRRQLCAKVGQNLLCSVWMILGMSAGTLLVHQLMTIGGNLGAAGMFGSMFAGMVWGMVVSVALYRLYFRWRDSQADSHASSRA